MKKNIYLFDYPKGCRNRPSDTKRNIRRLSIKLSDMVEWIKNNPTNIWFLFIFCSVLTYNVLNWDDCTDFSYISGDNILFIALVVLAFIPFI
jgi:hypothetical protein